MVPLIFTLKKLFVKPFGFEKKVCNSVSAYSVATSNV